MIEGISLPNEIKDVALTLLGAGASGLLAYIRGRRKERLDEMSLLWGELRSLREELEDCNSQHQEARLEILELQAKVSYLEGVAGKTAHA